MKSIKSNKLFPNLATYLIFIFILNTQKRHLDLILSAYLILFAGLGYSAVSVFSYLTKTDFGSTKHITNGEYRVSIFVSLLIFFGGLLSSLVVYEKNLSVAASGYFTQGWLIARFLSINTLLVFFGFLKKKLGVRAYIAISLAIIVIAFTILSYDYRSLSGFQYQDTLLPVILAVSSFCFSLGSILFMKSRTKTTDEKPLMEDLSKLVFGFNIFWFFLFLCGMLITWYGSSGAELEYLMSKLHGNNLIVTIIVITLHFALPFFLLITEEMKQKPLLARFAGIATCVGYIFEMYWIII
jgi:hypothetical protein